MKRKIVKKALLIIFTFGEVFLLNMPYAFGKFSVPSAGSIMSSVEDRYHLNSGSLQNLGENMNVSGNKMDAPSVSVFFTPTSPKAGEKVTAQALPMYFKSPKENMYFTWYIRHKDNKDENGHKKDEADWKREAMKIVANGGWEPDLDKDGDGVDDYSNTDAWYAAQPLNADDDKYEATVGGEGRGDLSSSDKDYCYLKDSSDGDFYEFVSASSGQTVSCATGSLYCGITEDSLESGAFGGTDDAFTATKQCTLADSDTANAPTCNSGTAYCSIGTPVCAVADGTNLQTTGNVDAACGDLPDPVCTGNNPNISHECKPAIENGIRQEHVFARARTTGDNSFDRDEEKLWGTNPNDADTDDDGVKDEADAAGLGQDKFSWYYQPGDEVGVVVEGVGMNPTKHTGSTYMIMWAFSKNKCEPTGKGTYIENIKKYNVTFKTTSTDINECLEDNLLDPKQGGQAGPMEVTLMTSPDNPLNDISDNGFGDIVSVQSIVSNSAQDEKQLFYKWSVKVSSDGTPNPATWNTINSDDLAAAGFRLKQGNGLAAVSLGMNFKNKAFFKNGIGYFKIRAEVREAIEVGAFRRGIGEAIIKVVSSQERIRVRKVEVGAGSSVKFVSGSALCDGKEDNKALCYVAKGEILGVEIDPDIDGSGGDDLKNFNWTLDGKTLICDPGFSSECEKDKQNWKNFFPVIKNIGETHVVELSANNINTGQVVNYQRTFMVAQPYIQIVSADEAVAWPKLLGAYKDLDQVYEDKSESIIEALADTDPVKLKAEIHPAWLEDDCEGQWFVDGEPVLDGVEDGNGSGLSEILNINSGWKNPGEIFNISLRAVCNKGDYYRKALNEIWGVSESASVEQVMEGKLQVEVSDVESAEKQDENVFATVFANAPGQMVFLLRILLTVFLIIFVSGAVFTLAPQRRD